MNAPLRTVRSGFAPLAAHPVRPRGQAVTPRQATTTRRNTYALKVRGNRLSACNLFDGDVIIIRRFQHDAHSETSSAQINQREIALRKLSISRQGVELWPEDALHPAVFLHNRDIEVLGMVMGIAHGQ